MFRSLVIEPSARRQLDYGPTLVIITAAAVLSGAAWFADLARAAPVLSCASRGRRRLGIDAAAGPAARRSRDVDPGRLRLPRRRGICY